MSAKYPRGLKQLDRPFDFHVPGFNCIMSLWVIRPNFFLMFHTQDGDILKSEYTYIMRRTKHGKWLWTFNTNPENAINAWSSLNTSDLTMQDALEQQYQNYLFSTQIEQSLTENIME